jgi:hypothetical protein
VLVFLVLGSDSPKDYDDVMEKDELRGTWQLVAEDRNGHSSTVSQLRWLRNRSGEKLAQLLGRSICMIGV